MIDRTPYLINAPRSISVWTQLVCMPAKINIQSWNAGVLWFGPWGSLQKRHELLIADHCSFQAVVIGSTAIRTRVPKSFAARHLVSEASLTKTRSHQINRKFRPNETLVCETELCENVPGGNVLPFPSSFEFSYRAFERIYKPFPCGVSCCTIRSQFSRIRSALFRTRVCKTENYAEVSVNFLRRTFLPFVIKAQAFAFPGLLTSQNKWSQPCSSSLSELEIFLKSHCTESRGCKSTSTRTTARVVFDVHKPEI